MDEFVRCSTFPSTFQLPSTKYAKRIATPCRHLAYRMSHKQIARMYIKNTLHPPIHQFSTTAATHTFDLTSNMIIDTSAHKHLLDPQSVANTNTLPSLLERPVMGTTCVFCSFQMWIVLFGPCRAEQKFLGSSHASTRHVDNIPDFVHRRF